MFWGDAVICRGLHVEVSLPQPMQHLAQWARYTKCLGGILWAENIPNHSSSIGLRFGSAYCVVE